METTGSALEIKLAELETYISEKSCFGLIADCGVCDTCHLKGVCPEYTVARLVFEERVMEHTAELESLDDEMSAAEEAPKAIVRSETLDWPAVIGLTIKQKPKKFLKVQEIIAARLPEGIDAAQVANFTWTMLKRLEEKGILIWDGNPTSGLEWA